ncbi:hypothetical protein GCK32_005471 [Trichostrongylus colubriformis]|uniref:Uncharacterized protein n=1 Tax=Trichostrongylus colubriformis TaxID=6319 RepID=A0AAN8ISZ9_TRICO
MNLRTFISNSAAVSSQINENDRALSTPAKTKVLDVDYVPEAEVFLLKTNFILKPQANRDFIYDPIGLRAPLTIVHKHLLRTLFDIQIEWNTHRSQVQRGMARSTKNIDSFYVEVPRRLFPLAHPQTLFDCGSSLTRAIRLWPFDGTP